MGGMCSWSDDDKKTEAVPGQAVVQPQQEVAEKSVINLIRYVNSFHHLALLNLV